MRIWFKCKNPDCECAWYDDSENTFSGCPECGSDFDIIDEEIAPNHHLTPTLKANAFRAG